MGKEDTSLKVNMFWNFIGNLFYMATQWILTILVVRLAGYSVSGEFALAISVTNIFYAVAVYGMRNYQVSDIESQFSDLDYILSRVVTNVFAVILCMLFCRLNSYSRQQCWIIFLYMLFKVSESFIDVFHGCIQKKWRLDLIGQSFLLRAFFNTLVFVVVLMLTDSLAISIFFMMVVSFSVLIFFDIRKGIGKWTSSDKVVLPKVMMLLKMVFPFAIYYCMINIIGTLPR